MWIFLLLAQLPLHLSRAAMPSPVPSASPLQLGFHGGKVIYRSGRHVEVKTSRANKLLHVYVPKSEGKAPKNMSVIIHGDAKTGRTVQLKAVEPTDDGFYHYQSEIDDSSELSPQNTSSAGLEVQFDFGP